MSNFIEKCLSGEALLDDVDDYVDAWHESESKTPLYEYLGMKRSEYTLWVSDPDVLAFIVTAHRQSCDVAEVLEEFNTLPLAARADGPHKAKELMQWLKAEGLWQ